MTTTPPPDPGTPQYTHDALVAGLAVKATELEQAAEDLRGAYRFSRQLKAILVIGGVLLTVLAYNSFTNRTTLHEVKKSSNLILSCTDPEGDCAKAGAASQGKAVADIISAVNEHTDLVFITTILCERQTKTVDGFTACMANKGIVIGDQNG